MARGLGILGEKLGMTQWFDEEGNAQAATVIRAQPNVIVQVKSSETDGYNALQLGFRPTKEHRVTKPQLGHFRKAGVPPCRVLREFRVDDAGDYRVGQTLGVELFEVGERISVRGRSKGRGTQGVVKRHGFAGGMATHGHSESLRKAASIGTMRATGKVFKGKRMHGHMGDERVTVRNLRVLKVDTKNHLIVVGGAVPGAKFGVVELVKHG